MKAIKSLIFLSSLFVILEGCKKLDVGKNPNEPEFEDVYSNSASVKSIASGLFNTWYIATHSYTYSPAMFLATASDNVTCSWGNQAMRDMSWEPRNAWNNASNYAYRGTTKEFFDRMYRSINTASNVMKAINAGLDIGNGGVDNNQVKAFAKFNQGIAYGMLALFFDRGFIVDENITIPDATVATASTPAEVAAAAVSYLDEAILLSNNTFTIPASWLGTPGDYSSVEFKKLCNSWAARILANMPRNKAQLAAVDWNKVKTYADAGLTSDFTIQQDGYVNWYAEAGDYLTFPGWGKVDMYVVNLMDNTQPQHWDDNSSFPTPPESTNPQDERIFTDFEYSSLNWFQAARGYYHFSNYRYARYDAAYALGDGPVPDFMKAENDMLRAEARAYTGDLAGAAAVINAGTRVTRGNMTPVAANLAEIEKAIHHERHVELYITGMGVQFFEMRKKDLLQKGTPLHWPLPGQTLETFGEKAPFYTFGGVANADGTNTSNAGWR
ncbi:MAG: RagB/SusD family nutrient uptake outer membrane protein [Chitinophagales bacterium]|nr:RagB/SusD family nutrient uptake outer membrane protein [Chitinophagales bacterium]